MAFHHRKLLNESAVDQSLAKFCDPFCHNKTTNPDPICPLKCMDLCPYSCDPALLLLPPPPLSPETPIPVFATAPEKPNTLSICLTISLAILATAFLLFTCYTIYRFFSGWLRRRRRQLEPPPENEAGDFVDEEDLVDHPIWYIRTVGLQPSVISAITIVRFKKGDGLIDGTDCSVCLNEFLEDETLRLLPKCNHAFHIPCIDTWLRSHTNCPMCRAGIVGNAGPLPSQELVVRDSGPAEEARLGNVEVLRESELEIEPSDLGIRVEDEGESRAQIGLKEPVRRSVSLDSLSASVISSAVADHCTGRSDVNLDNQLVEVKESQSGVISIEGTIQTGSCSIKRSLSCSAKVFLSRKDRNSDNPQ